jgi:signal transduction histidine kinase
LPLFAGNPKPRSPQPPRSWKTAGIAEARPALNEILAKYDGLRRLRGDVDAALQLTRDRRPSDLGPNWVVSDGKLVEAIDALSDLVSGEMSRSDPFITEMMEVKQLAWMLRDAAGFDRLMVGAVLASGKAPPVEQQLSFAVQTGRIETAWKGIEADARLPQTPAPLRAAVEAVRVMYFGELRARRQALLDALAARESVPISGSIWVKLTNPALAAIMDVANTAFDLTQAHAVSEAGIAARNFYLALFLAALSLGLGVFAMVYVVRQVARPIARLTEAMQAVTEGNLDCDIPFIHRNDEIGALAGALSIFRDNAREKLRVESELLRRERLSALGQLTASVAHELRNPLSAVRNTLYTIKDAATRGGWSLERPLARMERSVARCDRIIGELLDYTGMRKLDRTLVLVDRWLGEILDEQELPPDVVLIRKLGAPGEQARFDMERMRQVVINLIENAAQAIATIDSPRERFIIVTSRVSGDAFDFTIEDTGPGIPRDALDKVFEPLFSTKNFGTGLGLAIAKQIVERHGGTITIASEPGQGTVAAVRLPRKAVSESAVAEAPPAGAPAHERRVRRERV